MGYFLWYNHIMTISKLVHRDKSLVKAFKHYSKRYLSVSKIPDLKKFLPEVVYRNMRLEGEKISRKEVRSLFT